MRDTVQKRTKEPHVKMRDKILLTYIITDLLFVASGGLLIIFALVTKSEITSTPTLDNVARDLLFNICPLNGMLSLLVGKEEKC